MAKPIIKTISANSFLDGSVVYENDARIGGEIDGNVEIADLSEPRSTYNITVGPLYYGPDSIAVPASTPTWETPDVSVLVFQAPRDMVLVGISAHISNEINVSTADTIFIGVYKASAADGISGAYRSLSATNWVHVLNTSVFIDGSGTNDLYADSMSGATLDIAAGEFVRVILTSGGDDAQAQAELSITLTVTEDHAE